MSILGRALAALILLSLAAIGAPAQNTIYVPSGQPTIQKGIDAAQNGDTVLVAPGTYQENVNFKGKAITVTSSGGPAVTTIDGGGQETVVTFKTGESTASTLNGFTITNGNGYVSFGGGGITIKYASPTVTNNVIIGNRAYRGVGIQICCGSPVIRGNTVTNNIDTGAFGAGIQINAPSEAQIVENMVSYNQGAFGGGIEVDAASPLISGNKILANSVYGDGGGLVVNYGHPLVVNNVIAANSAGGKGGGIYVSTDIGPQGPVFLNNTIVDNQSTSNTWPFVTADVHVLRYDGGASVLLANNLVYTSVNQAAIYCTLTSDGVVPTFLSNDVINTNGANYAGMCTDVSGTNGNISVDPLFVNRAVRNFHLQPNSPALDAGDNGASNLPAKDLDGNPRIADGNNDCVATVDMCAYELTKTVGGTFAPASVDFGDQLTNTTSAPMIVTFTSSGGTCLLLSGITASGDFAEAQTCPAKMPAGTSCPVSVTFTPSTTGLRTGTLAAAGNFSGAPPTAALSGNGVVASIQLSPASLNFGNQLVGVPSGPLPVTVTNVGTGTLFIFGISTTAEFTWTSDCGTSLAPNASCTIRIVFTPAAVGPRSGTFTVSSNAPTGSPTVTLLGNGVAQQQLYAIWSNATPAVIDAGADSSVELGVKFTADVGGTIQGIRFYKAAANTGTHTGSLWDSQGHLLATATFTGETASGWQQVNFAAPVTITANTVYVASYHTSVGHYSLTSKYFATSGADNPPLHAPASGTVGGNGVYKYGASTVFPKSSYNASNYWVDVVFATTATADFTVSAAPSSVTVAQGNSGTSTITTTISGGFNAGITLSTSALPSGVTAAFVPNPIAAPGSGTSTLTFTASASAAVGTTTVTITGLGGGITHTTTVQLTVTQPDFTVSAAPSSVTVAQGNSGTSTITTTISGGFNAGIMLSTSALPSGVTAAFAPNPIAAPGSGTSTLTFTATASAAAGKTTVTITGVGGGITHTTTVTLTVQSGTAAASSIWSNATPAVVDAGADSSVELGVKFTADIGGTIQGIRFYKAAANTGTHIGSLWDSQGHLLATATFTGETASGWQQVTFSSPVTITANTVYVASYHTSVGHYSLTSKYFATSGADNPPLHAPASGAVGGNGVYKYGASTVYPANSYNATNYWVDIVFAQ